MDWIAVTAVSALAAMPVRYRARYDAWIALHPDFETRYAEIVAQKVLQARASIESRPGNVLDPDTTTIPDSAVLPILNLILYQTMFEIEDAVNVDEDLRSSMIRADMYVQSLRFTNVTNADGEPSPSYTEPETPRGTLL